MRAAIVASTLALASALAFPARAASSPDRAAGSARIDLPEIGRQIFLADLDGDGRDEPVVVYGGKSGCNIGRIVHADGTFRFETISLGEGEHVVLPSLADVTEDGTLDLVSLDDRGAIVRKGLGKEAFASAPSRLVESSELLLPTEGCTAGPSIVADVEGDSASELLLPILGGVRVISLARAGADSSAPATPAPEELLTEPYLGGSESRLVFRSALPSLVETPKGRLFVLGPLARSGTGRLEFAWWSRDATDGSLVKHKSALALPPGEFAFDVHPFDLEGDGRPEMAVLTMPARLSSFLGEFNLHVYRAGEWADAGVNPFFTAKTEINFWQLPSIQVRPAPGGSDLMLAFYRGLMKAHLNVEVFRSDGAGSFVAKPREVSLPSSENAKRGYLVWTDVDRDGTADLVTADDSGLRIFRGLADRDRLLAATPTWTASIIPHDVSTSATVSNSGFSISIDAAEIPAIADLDGDGTLEVITFLSERNASVPGGAVVIAPLRAEGR